MQKKVLGICLVIALLEGFAGLGIEIYAIRISATYIGSSISITGVILAMVLIAIAVGYWYGGRLSQDIDTPKQALLKAGHVLSLSAISHAIACIIQLPLLAMMTASTDSPILAAIGVGLLFGVGLAFGSTAIPLITQFLSLKHKRLDSHDQGVDAGKNAGMMVAVTTIGSVLGSTLTPIVLLPYIGLMSSLALFIAALAISAWLCTKLAKHMTSDEPGSQSMQTLNHMLALSAVVVTAAFIILNKVDTGYQTATGAWFINQVVIDDNLAVTITDKPGKSTSSCWIYLPKKNCHWYGNITVQAIDDLNPDSLVFLGGAGMGTPSEVAHHNPKMALTVIDIDKDLPEIIEAHFLKAPIAPNIEFIGDDARGYLTRHRDARYDFMLIDAFQGRHVAGNLYTVEALTQFQDNSNHIMANVIGMPNPAHGYSQTIFKNWYEVFGDSAYILTKNDSDTLQNIMLCNFDCPGSQRLAQAGFLNKDQPLHTDDVPRLDRYLYRSIERL
ncbi:fused MFS/spermidine synthase [Psychrobacter sp.]|uniref:fused MFS/spermidine synthase n=1 Tax=Psychrobacter sp. TaxID=56811 RepID=UPI00264929C0|nr:fused MFS/spermidine synthase [Psychrobacter sp.]MDN6274958.1 fused MFS/spermidine synthase [Psychrobacter sp.]MDN6307772.1 fused MFS/spermidine synthase [Psychrobacter sp.]